jgi:hypothetical protein
MKSARHVFRKALLGVLSLTLLGGACRWYYFRELRMVTAELNAIPGIRVLEAWGNEDLRLEDIWTSIAIANGPTVRLFNLSQASFANAGGFCLDLIDDYDIRWTGYGRFWGPSTSPGHSGSNCLHFGGGQTDLPQLFPAGINTVSDLIRSVEDVKKVLAQWPKCPDYISASSTRGDYRLCTTSEDQLTYPPLMGSS